MSNPMHAKLVSNLKALTAAGMAKKAENPGEAKLTTSHPSGSESADSDGTSKAVVGARYQENSDANKTMYPGGTDTAGNNKPGTEEKDPGNNKGLKVRPAGEEVPGYDLENHNDPGTSHPVGKEAMAKLAKDATEIATMLRAVIKQAAEGGDAYVSGTIPDKATEDTDKNAKGTTALKPGVDNLSSEGMEGGQAGGDGGKVAELRAAATADFLALTANMKRAAAADAEAFVATVNGVVSRLMPAKQASWTPEAQLQSIAAGIDAYDAAVAGTGMPKFASLFAGALGLEPAKKVAKTKVKKAEDAPAAEEEEGDEGEDEGSSEEAESGESKPKSKGKAKSAPPADGAEAAPAGPAAGAAGAVSPDASGAAPADAVLAQMAQTPVAPDAMGGGIPGAMPGGMPGAAPAGGAPQLSPEEEALLMQLMQQEGMKQADIKAYNDYAQLLATKKLAMDQLSAPVQEYLRECDRRVKLAGAKFDTIKSAAAVRKELNQIAKGYR